MAKWYKIETFMRNVAEETQAQRLGMDDVKPAAIIRPVMIDLDRVETYSAMFDEEGEEIGDESIITMHSGVDIGVRMPFNVLDKLIRREN